MCWLTASFSTHVNFWNPFSNRMDRMDIHVYRLLWNWKYCNWTTNRVNTSSVTLSRLWALLSSGSLLMYRPSTNAVVSHTLPYSKLTLMYGSQWGSLAAAHNLLKAIFSNTSHTRIRISTASQYCKSHENPYQVLQVTFAASECCNEIEGSYDKIIITIVPSYTWKNITRLLPLALLLMLRTRNNTDDKQTCDIFWYSFVLWWYLYMMRTHHQHLEQLTHRKDG